MPFSRLHVRTELLKFSKSAPEEPDLSLGGHALPRAALAMSDHTVQLVPPQGPAARRTRAEPRAVHPAYLDALAVRKAVFVDEQQCDPEADVDADDERSWHFVIYVSALDKRLPPSTDEAAQANPLHWPLHPPALPPKAHLVPAATARLVPPPHAPHPLPGSRDNVPAPPAGHADPATALHDGAEAYVKLGRLATLAPFRGMGLARTLVHAALDWARLNGEEIRGGPGEKEWYEGLHAGWRPPTGRDWRGLALVHAQRNVQGFYRRCGFEWDEALGSWWEEGIEHVAMWKRVEVQLSRVKKEKTQGVGTGQKQ